MLNEDIVNLFKAASVGSLADDYGEVDLLNKTALSIVLFKMAEYLFDESQSEIKYLNEIPEEIAISFYNTINKDDNIRAKSGRILSLTSVNSVLSQAKKTLLEWVDCVDFKGKRYRKDILENINER